MVIVAYSDLKQLNLYQTTDLNREVWHSTGTSDSIVLPEEFFFVSSTQGQLREMNSR